MCHSGFISLYRMLSAAQMVSFPISSLSSLDYKPGKVPTQSSWGPQRLAKLICAEFNMQQTWDQRLFQDRNTVHNASKDGFIIGQELSSRIKSVITFALIKVKIDSFLALKVQCVQSVRNFSLKHRKKYVNKMWRNNTFDDNIYVLCCRDVDQKWACWPASPGLSCLVIPLCPSGSIMNLCGVQSAIWHDRRKK